MTHKNGKIITYDFGTQRNPEFEDPGDILVEELTTAELIAELLRRGEHEIILRQPRPTETVDDRTNAFQTAVELDREMERSVLYRVFIAIELICLILLLRTIAIHFI